MTTSVMLKSSPVPRGGPAAASESEGKTAKPRRLPLLESLLAEQQELSAVEKFAQLHESEELPAQAKYYKRLLPTSAPQEGQQYSFSVDLDKCTGCKACVTACHSLNGLDEEETWRSVGLLHGGTADAPMQQTVTTACHHCLDPACMNGCPVNAYEKHPVTGIVKHLDDQCIGCQYCTLTCPYDVPQFSKKLGIVRKCDLCSDRLAEGEAPACVQACPNEAIAIRLVDRAQVIEDVQADTFLPGAPSPGLTMPTTEYKTQRVFPKNTLPADFYSVRPAHNHLPLVVLLVFNQLSVGAFAVDYVTSTYYGDEIVQRYHALVAVAMGTLALAVSFLHLGRPQYGFRAVMGIRHSWMSREAAAIGAFASLSAIYAAGAWADQALRQVGLPPLDPALAETLQRGLGAAVALSGIVGIACSVMLYVATRRSFWRASQSGPRFFLSAALQGLALSVFFAIAADYAGVAMAEGSLPTLLHAVIGVAACKLCFEASIFSHLRRTQVSDLKRTALLMKGELSGITQMRFALGMLGGIFMPALLTTFVVDGGLQTSSSAPLVIALLSGAAITCGELMERSLFFMAAAAPRMPGAVGK